jgi:hypothetical protein
MITTIAQMTTEDFRTMLENIVAQTIEKKLTEMMGDPDFGLTVRRSVRDRLMRQQQDVKKGRYGHNFEDAIARMETE